LQRNRVAKMFELPSVVAFDLRGSGAFEVIRAEVLVWLALCEHMPRDDQDRMSDRDESPLLASVDQAICAMPEHSAA
jgi:hypothetical protein